MGVLGEAAEILPPAHGDGKHQQVEEEGDQRR